MTTLQYLSEDELIRQGLEALMKALGPIETTRFLTLPHPPVWNRFNGTAGGKPRWTKKTFFKQVFGAAGEAGGNE